MVLPENGDNQGSRAMFYSADTLSVVVSDEKLSAGTTASTGEDTVRYCLALHTWG